MVPHCAKIVAHRTVVPKEDNTEKMKPTLFQDTQRVGYQYKDREICQQNKIESLETAGMVSSTCNRGTLEEAKAEELSLRQVWATQ